MDIRSKSIESEKQFKKLHFKYCKEKKRSNKKKLETTSTHLPIISHQSHEKSHSKFTFFLWYIEAMIHVECWKNKLLVKLQNERLTLFPFLFSAIHILFAYIISFVKSRGILHKCVVHFFYVQAERRIA